MLDHLTTALDLGYIDEAEFGKYRALIIDSVKSSNGYIRMLSRRKAIHT